MILIYGDEITHLKSAYHTTPFKVAEIREDKNSAVLELMLMSSSPGILDGDCYDFEVTVQENCKLEFSTQSYQRIFTMKGSAVAKKMKVAIKKMVSYTTFLTQWFRIDNPIIKQKTTFI